VGISIGALSFWVNAYRSLMSRLTGHIPKFARFNGKLKINSVFNSILLMKKSRYRDELRGNVVLSNPMNKRQPHSISLPGPYGMGHRQKFREGADDEALYQIKGTFDYNLIPFVSHILPPGYFPPFATPTDGAP